MKVILRIASACEWKLLLITPDVVTHNEKPHRSTTCELVLYSLKRVIKPLQSGAGCIHNSVLAKRDVTYLPCRRRWSVSPWTHDQALSGASFRCIRLLMQTGVIL